MATTDKNTLKGWFKRGLKPLASQFEAWLDSYYHKDEPIPTDKVEGLAEILINKLDRTVALQMISDALSNIPLPEATLEKKGIVQLSNTPGQSELEAATPLLVSRATQSAVNDLRGEVYTRQQTDNVATTKATEAVSGVRDGVPAEGDTLKKLHDLFLLLQSLVASDDVNLDTVKEIVAFIKNNKDVIDTIATSKVAIVDIVDGLTSSAANKPLSANQGKVLRDMLASLEKSIRLAICFSNTPEAVISLPIDATVKKIAWSATDIASVEVSTGGAFSPVASGGVLTISLAAYSPLRLRVVFAIGKSLGSVVLEGNYTN